MLADRDYTLILDKSGSMAVKDQKGGRSRWAAARESTEAPSQLSPTYRACAWAMDALKSAEEIWRRELEWRAQQQGPDAQIGGHGGDSFP